MKWMMFSSDLDAESSDSSDWGLLCCADKFCSFAFAWPSSSILSTFLCFSSNPSPSVFFLVRSPFSICNISRLPPSALPRTSTPPFLHPSVHTFLQPTSLLVSVRPSVPPVSRTVLRPSLVPSLRPNVRPSCIGLSLSCLCVCICVYVSACLCPFIWFCLSVRPSVCNCVCMRVYLSVCLCHFIWLRLSVRPSVRPSIHPSVCNVYVCVPICLSVCHSL